MNFHQFYDKLNEPVRRMPPPPKYEIGSYLDFITSNPENVMTADEGPSWQGTPIADEDMYRYADEDVVADMKNKPDPTKLGPEMTDREFHRWHGITWGKGE